MDSYTEVFTWGSNTYGQMGLESSSSNYPSPRICSFSVLIIQVSCGVDHSAFLSTQHFIYSMGSNSDGKLGIGNKNLAYSSYPLLIEALVGEKISQVSCGGFHSAAINNEGELFTWGKGVTLGHEDQLTRWSPLKLEIEYTYIIQVSCGNNHTGIIAIRNNERICMTWGSGEYGQLGTGNRENQEIPTKALVSDIKDVSCGENFTLFLNINGSILSTGRNNNGQLGLGNNKDMSVPTKIKALDPVFITKICAGGLSGCITEDGALYIWGLNTFCPSLVRGSPKDVVDLSIGRRFGCAITRTSALWTWGDNSSGQLGLGDYNEKNGICIVNSLSKKKVKMAACGSDFIMVLGEDLHKTQNSSKKPEKSPEKAHKPSEVLEPSKDSDKKAQKFEKSQKKSSQEQFWSSERNETKKNKDPVDITLYENALKKLNKLLIKKDKQLEYEKEYRLKNDEKVYFDLKTKLDSVEKTIEFEKLKREELEIIHTKNENKLLNIIREKEEEICFLKTENAKIRKNLDERQPCTTCVNILSEFNSLRAKNESLLEEVSKTNSKKHKTTIKTQENKETLSINNSGYMLQSPSFDKSLDKSLDRRKLINNQLKISRSESELLGLIEAPINSRSPRRTDRSNDRQLPLLNLNCQEEDEYALPTFRNQENSMQKNLKNSLADIKARINALNSNRSDLQTKMEELELKLLKSPTNKVL